MKEANFLQGFEARIRFFGLDERSRIIMTGAWPLIAPRLDEAIEGVLAAAAGMPLMAPIVGNLAIKRCDATILWYGSLMSVES